MTQSKCPRCESPAPHLHPAMQADGGEIQPCTHPFHGPPDKDTSEEEPAWRAELLKELEEGFPFVRNAVTRDAIREFAERYIQAAEERGRRQALRDAAEQFSDDAERSTERRRTEILAGVAYLLRTAAESP